MSSPVNLNYAGVYLPLSASSHAWLSSATAQVITGTSANDTLYGNGKSQTLQGGAGDDIYYIYGAEQVVEQPNQGTDTIISNWTNVLLPTNVENLYVSGNYYGYGNAQNNVIVGDASNQVIDGGSGNDVLTGGGGHDTFVFDAQSGHDVITDFAPGAGSVVRLAGYSQFTDIAQVESHMAQQGSDVVLTLDANDSITFRNTTIAQFSASDFMLGFNASSKQATFAENFNSLSLRSGTSGTWLPYFNYGGPTNSVNDHTNGGSIEQEIYVDPSMAGQGSKPLGLNPFSVSNGILTITAAPTPAADIQALYGYKYTSGLLTTHGSFSQEYGYFEINAKLPTAPGTWPCFWLLPANGGWPPEIDVMESNGGGVVTQSIHTGASNTTTTVTNNLVSTSNSFHTYGVLWDPQHITFFMDHVETAQYNTPSDMHQAMYMLLDLAVKAGAPASSIPASMQVDYIHAYSLANAPTDVVSTAATTASNVSPQTWTISSLASATPASPYNIAAFNPGHGDLIDLSGLDAIPATAPLDTFKLVTAFDGHAGEIELVQTGTSGGWELLGDTTGSGHASFEATLHVTGSLTSYADIASHLIL